MSEADEYFILTNVRIESCDIAEMKFLVKNIWSFSFNEVTVASGNVFRIYVNGTGISVLGNITNDFMERLTIFEKRINKV